MHYLPLHAHVFSQLIKLILVNGFLPDSIEINSCLHISSRRFGKKTSKWARIFAQKAGDSQVSGHCDEKKHRGLAVLVGLIVKLSP